jgi:hypothetical protein
MNQFQFFKEREMRNYLTMGIISHGRILMFPIDFSTLNSQITMTAQNNLKGEFYKAYTNKGFVKNFEKTNSFWVNTNQISALHISIL